MFVRSCSLLFAVKPAALLRRIGRIDFDEGSPSFFRFGGQAIKELRPCRVTDAFRKTMMVNHAIDVQVLHTNHAESVYDLARRLMCEIIPTEGNPLMNACNHLPMLLALGCPFRQFGVLSLSRCQRLFFLTKEPGIRNFRFIRQHGKRLESHINPNGGINGRQAERFALNRKAHVPLPCPALVNGTRFETSLEGPMIDHLDRANLGKRHAVIMRDGKATLGEAETIVAVTPTEPGISRSFYLPPRQGARFHTAKERFEGQINPNGDVLQGLGMDGTERGALFLQHRKRGLLTVERRALACVLIRRFAVLQQVIIQPTAFVKRRLKGILLFLGRIEPILKGFPHRDSVAQTMREVKRGAASHHAPEGRASHPLLERQGLSRPFM